MAPNFFCKQLLLAFKQLKKISNAKPAPKTNGDSGDSVSEVIDDDGRMANGTAAHVEKLVEESDEDIEAKQNKVSGIKRQKLMRKNLKQLPSKDEISKLRYI